MIRITVIGATGRMGRALVRLIAEAERMELAGAATEPGDRLIGQDAGALAQIGLWVSLSPKTWVRRLQAARSPSISRRLPPPTQTLRPA